jgi:hypothetical protein
MNATENSVAKLVDLIQQRFELHLDTSCPQHLTTVMEHYRAKREMLLRGLGEADALRSEDYAKAVLISETARFTLREIAPKRRKKTRKDRI